MKKSLPYIIAGVIVLLLVVILALGNRPGKSFNERISLRKEEKIPYGAYVARDLIPSLFPDADISINKKEPDEWSNAYEETSNEAVISVSREFHADEDELFDMLRFVKSGNYVFIASQKFSEDAQEFFRISTSPLAEYLEAEDSLQVRLERPPFATDSLFAYPGKKFTNWIYGVDTLRTTILGRDALGRPDFIRMDAGAGSIFIHLSPLVFSNYFILHKNNVRYYEQAMSVIPNGVDKIVWNEYYLSKRADRRNNNNEEREPSFLRVLMKEPAFAWALWIAIFTILLYALMEMRRKQRFIPAYTRPQNDSLDFIKTIGRLYYDRKDHHNLAKKMSTYFLEHVRANYKLPTHTLHEKFVQALHYKSGYDLEKTTSIVEFIRQLDFTSSISEEQLFSFHKQLENFYQTT